MILAKGWEGKRKGEREARPAGGTSTRGQPRYRYKYVMLSNEPSKNREGREERKEGEREGEGGREREIDTGT